MTGAVITRAWGPCGVSGAYGPATVTCSAGLRPVLNVVGPQAAMATPAPETAHGVHHGVEERAVDGADDPAGPAARHGTRPRPTTTRVGPDREAENVALLLGLSGHRDPRRRRMARVLPSRTRSTQW